MDENNNLPAESLDLPEPIEIVTTEMGTYPYHPPVKQEQRYYYPCCDRYSDLGHRPRCGSEYPTQEGIPLDLKTTFDKPVIKTKEESQINCCSAEFGESHLSYCTSNEAVIGRADPELKAKKQKLWAAHRDVYGDPLGRMAMSHEMKPEDIREHQGGKFIPLTPRPAYTSGGEWKPVEPEKPAAPLTPDYVQGLGFNFGPPIPAGRPRLCEVCSQSEAKYPRERERVLEWKGFKLRLGSLFRVRPWVCMNCRIIFNAGPLRQKGVERKTVRRFLGRELQALGQWLAR